MMVACIEKQNTELQRIGELNEKLKKSKHMSNKEYAEARLFHHSDDEQEA